MSFDWNDANVAWLTERWGKASASTIANELGDGVTRSSVISKAHRIGLDGIARGPKPKPRPARRERFRAAPTKRPPAMLPDVTREATEAVELLSDTDIPQAQRRTLMELTDETCRWPIGEPNHAEFFFCGAQVVPSCVYCIQHAVRAYKAGYTYTDSQQRWLRNRFAG